MMPMIANETTAKLMATIASKSICRYPRIREKKIDTFDDFANVYTNLHIRLTYPALMPCTSPIRKRNKM
jgi:hypothetical protein